MPGIACRHHVLRIEHLRGQLGDALHAVLPGALGCERGKTGHEEVQPRKRNHIDGKFTKIGIQLTWESETRCHTGHGELECGK